MTAWREQMRVHSVQLRRLPNAAEALAALSAARQRTPFAWGVHDCCLWAADAIAAQVGQDPARGLRGRYRSALGAQRVTDAMGGLEAIATAALGQPLSHPMLACGGDIGLIECGAEGEPARLALAVCIGEWWTAPGADCMTHRPLSAALTSWRVG